MSAYYLGVIKDIEKELRTLQINYNHKCRYIEAQVDELVEVKLRNEELVEALDKAEDVLGLGLVDGGRGNAMRKAMNIMSEAIAVEDTK